MGELEVFADIGCPFTHVGLHRLVAERRRRGVPGPRLRVRAWPLGLVNGAGLTGPGVADKVAALRRDVAPDLFQGFDPSTFPVTSNPALALAAAAYRHGVAIGESVSLALRDAVFEEGFDVTDPAVLEKIADAHAIGPVTDADEASVVADWVEGTKRGVVGSPHFFVGDESWFCPTLTVLHRDDGIHIELDHAAFEEFTTQVFTTGPAPSTPRTRST